MKKFNADLDYYRVFSLVAEKGSMKDAAEELFISQPAVTKTIQTLEKQLGGTLFIRSNKGLTLTKEGENLLVKVNKALDIIEDGEKEFQNNYDLNSGEIRIGVSTVLTKILLMNKVKQFYQKYPNVRVMIENGLTPMLINELYSGKLDIVIYNDGLQAFDDLVVKRIAKLKYGFVYNPQFFHLEDTNVFANTLIVQKQPSFTRKFLEKYLNEKGIVVKNKIEVVSQELVKEFARIGMGIGFVYLDLIDDDFSVIDTDDIFTDVFVAQNKNTVQTRAVKEFLKLFNN